MYIYNMYIYIFIDNSLDPPYPRDPTDLGDPNLP